MLNQGKGDIKSREEWKNNTKGYVDHARAKFILLLSRQKEIKGSKNCLSKS